jgi:D-alanyl-D-alanine carboxypeptidase
MFENEVYNENPKTKKGIKVLIFISLIIITIAISYKKRDYVFTFLDTLRGNDVFTSIDYNDIKEKYPTEIDKQALDYHTIYVEDIRAEAKKIKKDKYDITAESYLLGNVETGEIYLENKKDKVFPIASLTKLILALVAVHNMDMDQEIVINKDMLKPYGNAGGLIEGEKYKVRELLFPLLLESSNDAAEAIALSYKNGYEGFIYQMNSFVSELGMNNTSFKDASGLSYENVSNSKDLFILAQYLYKNEKSILNITKNSNYTLASTTGHGLHVYKAIDPFVLDPNFLGGKTGRTIEAKESMISLFNYSDIPKIVKPIAVIVLRSNFSSREIDTSILFQKFMQKNGSI